MRYQSLEPLRLEHCAEEVAEQPQRQHAADQVHSVHHALLELLAEPDQPATEEQQPRQQCDASRFEHRFLLARTSPGSGG